MCILFIHTNPNPHKGGYRAVIASNRDEFYRRPAKSAYHCADTKIIGGRDMEPGREGGMWLGVALKQNTIAFGALLNVTGENKSGATKGRGPLVYDFLKSELNASDYLKTIENDAISAFNLVTVEITRDSTVTYHHSNSPIASVNYPGSQTLGFGNSTPTKPLKKVVDGRSQFEHIIQGARDKNELTAKLLDLLKSQERHLPDEELQRRAPNAFQDLSAIYVKIVQGEAGYGTRTHSIILVDYDFNVDFIEHTMKEPIDAENPQWIVNEIKARL